MLLTKTITKKILETIVHETFCKFGNTSSSSLLDSLKFLGFYYATNAGISINIEDLKTPNVKKKFIAIANEEINFVSYQWKQGYVSDTERFQSIIDSWNNATEGLKNKIIDYYQDFDPANNLYIMAFSGARGNMSQVRQLVGMRGLMSDQDGKIIDLPIQANFREGLSSIDYIISSYGARKGIVDTALKTADSGYLTRRLIYLAQDLVIREKNCKTKEGLLFIVKRNTNLKNIVGRTLLSAKTGRFPFYKIEVQEKILTLNDAKFFQSFPCLLTISSSLTCKSNGSICQKCYGWDLAQQKIISLGETVGIIAAQSIGEPGTQLTMRTFHTGGIFTGETLTQILSPFSGKLLLPLDLKTVPYRTNHGINVLKLQQEVRLAIINWKGIKKEIPLNIGSNLYLTTSSFVKKNQLLAEASTQNIIPGARKLKPIYTSFGGEIRFQKLLLRKIPKDTKTLKVNQDDCVVWIASGKIFPLPKEASYLFPTELKNERPIAILKLISPYQGIFEYSDLTISLGTREDRLAINCLDLIKPIRNCSIKFSPFLPNFQYVDKYTILGYLEIFANDKGLIYSVRKKESKYIRTFFVISESDIWKINSDQVNNLSFAYSKKQEKKLVFRSNALVTQNSKITSSGYFLKKDGLKIIFQHATPIFLSRGTILNYKQGDFVFKKSVFATLVNYTQQTEDIVQGLPKIEELIEARKPKTKCDLSARPGIFFNQKFSNRSTNSKIVTKKSIIKLLVSRLKIKVKKGKKIRKIKHQTVNVLHSFLVKKNFILFGNRVFKAHLIRSSFNPNISAILYANSFFIKERTKERILPKQSNIKLKQRRCLLFSKKTDGFFLFDGYKAKKKREWFSSEELQPNYFKNEQNDLIIETKKGSYFYLEYLNPLQKYNISLASKIVLKNGDFVDIGEPITEGIIDAHELLHILFRYHSMYDGITKGTLRSLTKFQLLLANSIQSIYQSQGVTISSKHIEIIVKQMTSRVLIRESGDTPFLPNELVRLSLITEVNKALKISKTIVKRKLPVYEPVLLSATNSALNKDGFLSSAGFQETKKVLTKAAVEGTSDWLRSLKESVIIGRLIPAGSAFLNYKNSLDNLYLFKNLPIKN